ncbi:MAG: hypothetical protein GY786_08805, partial [Proteobacteria bacterium]|nr:hypothetical protein [Pseudomonadota bacterium]
LASVFAIKICAYAVMSNHYHIVLFVDTEQAESWSDEEVTQRWGRLFRAQKKPTPCPQHDNPEVMMSTEEIWRERLQGIAGPTQEEEVNPCCKKEIPISFQEYLELIF